MELLKYNTTHEHFNWPQGPKLLFKAMNQDFIGQELCRRLIPYSAHMMLKRMAFGDKWYSWNMDVYGGDGVPDLLMVLTVLVYGRVSVRVGLLSHAIFCMILVMGPGWSFGKTVGVERHLLQLATLICSDFAGIRRLVWLSLWNPPMESFFGMWASLGVCMFRN